MTAEPERPGAAAHVPLSPRQRQALLALAGRAVRLAALGEPQELPPPADPTLHLDRAGAAFVTLRVGGELKGCIGTAEARASLWDTVHEMATAAATRDPRFAPVHPADLAALSLEISVLSPPRRVGGLADVQIGRHGLEVRRGGHRGLLLPQVATDHGLDRESFLAETCRKANLPLDAWRRTGTEIYVFEAEVFGDQEGGGNG